MDWIQFAIFFLGVGGLFKWCHSESRADQRQMLSIVQSIQTEMKDFHGRLIRQDAEFKAHMMHQHKEGK